MNCANCGSENRSGRKFCSRCGAPLALLCSHCGAANEPGDGFCGECGQRLEAAVAGDPAASTPTAPVSERRHVSVLFADLVGFTSLSERRDAEEVRDLLSRYFDVSRQLIARYGGTIEKFIGDAVMAVWGTPIATEDDPERAVRAALDLTQAVAALGSELEAPELALRVGVASGEAAVTIGAVGEGMVAGDLVNTAARVQSASVPGGVLVTEETRRATEASIVYEDAGNHELKGKEEAVHLWVARRVISGVGGSLRSSGLESPFVGRDRELRLIKDLFHATADQGRAHLFSVSGIGGIGKSRLAWEFFKYIDGLVEDVWWHRGRCIAYGDGVTYWALAEMVRMRAGIVEEEDPSSAAEKLRATVREFVPDRDEQRWVESRLAHLLGLEERAAPAREDLFAGWRFFFERIADRGPVAMVFEDLHWADDALLDLIDHLLEWSRDHPIFVVTLARPELEERHPEWGAGKRGFTSLYLEPLSDESMDELLHGMVPGLPNDLRGRIRDRAEGVPLYAVETVRMLLDRGLLSRVGSGFEPTGPIGELDVPESLHALIAARLDGLPTDERSLLQDASVIGKAFPQPTLARLSGVEGSRLDALLSSLVRKELIGIQTDLRSPERGQHAFLQSLVQRVAYGTLSRKDRKARHLRLAAIIDETWGGDEDEIVEVLASHYLEAYRLAPDDDDAPEIRADARDALARAGQRAQSLASTRLARGYYERASELADADASKAELLERAGEMAFHGGYTKDAMKLFEEAISLFGSGALTHAAARVSARIGQVLWLDDRADEAAERLETAFRVLEGEDADHDLAMLAAESGRIFFFVGRLDAARARIEMALDVAERLWLPDVLSEALNTKGLVLEAMEHFEEGRALLERSLAIALENDVPTSAVRAYTNLSNNTFERDRYEEGRPYQEAGIALARRLGQSGSAWFLTQHVGFRLLEMGDWDAAMELVESLPRPEDDPSVEAASVVSTIAMEIAVHRGDLDQAERRFADLAHLAGSPDVQTRTAYDVNRALLMRGKGQETEALASALAAFDARAMLGLRHGAIKIAFRLATDAAFALGDLELVERLTGEADASPRGGQSPRLRADRARARARLAVATGRSEEVEPGFRTAEELNWEMGTPFSLAVALSEHAEWLASGDRTEEARPLAEEARAIFERLAATPWIERVASVQLDLTPA